MDLSSCRGKAVILLSGGIDSATTLAIAAKAGLELYAISFDYQQRHRSELESAGMVASAFNVKKHLIIDINMRGIGGSALTSDIEVPKAGTAAGTIPQTYVPARNTVFLSFGLAWAEVLGADEIYIGANEVDYSGYPDCRPEYLTAFENMANLATKASVEGTRHFHIRAPLISMTKAEIIKKGAELGLDYGLTWSCYDPQPVSGDHSKLRPCRQCDSCRIREKGFQEAGIRDPLI
jgi:7-cyano-7-deazaguanine synthase